MPSLTEEQLAEVWRLVENSTPSQRRREMKREEEREGEIEDLMGDVHLDNMKKAREMRRMIENAPPANRPDLVGMQRFTDEIAQARRDERVDAAAAAARKDADFVPYDRVQGKKFSDMLPEGFVYVPKTVVEKTPDKKPWWRLRGGAGTTVSHVTLAAVVVVSEIVGSFR